MPIQENIKRLIKENGYTQKYVATQLGYDERRFCRMLNGKAILRADDVGKIAQWFCVTPNEIYGLEKTN